MSAVVFLILGIALLAGGFMFIRTLTQKTDAGVASIMKSGDLDKKADSYTPLVVDREISIKATETKAVEIAFYCNKPSGEVCGDKFDPNKKIRPFFAEDTSNSVISSSKCNGIKADGTPGSLSVKSDGTVNDGGISLSAVSTQVNAHETTGFKVILTTKLTDAGKYNCNIIVAKTLNDGKTYDSHEEPYESQQVFIDII